LYQFKTGEQKWLQVIPEPQLPHSC